VGSFANGSNKGIVRNNYDDRTGRSYDLELPELNLSSDNNPVLSFDYSYAFNTNCPQCIDELAVLVSKDCGKTYHQVFNKKGQALKTTTDNIYHYPKSNEWGTRTVNLSAYKTNVLIKIRATSGQGNLLFLDNIKVAEVSAICQTPTDLNELQVTSSSVKLSWKFQGNTDHFDLYYRPKNTSAWTHKIVAGIKQWINVTDLNADTDYEWYISASCNSGNSLASSYSFFTTETSLAQTVTSWPNEESKAYGVNEVKIYPNPVSSTATISFSIQQHEKVSLNLYDITGRMVNMITEREFNEGTHQITLDTKNLIAGIYLLRLQSQSVIETRKLVVLK